LNEDSFHRPQPFKNLDGTPVFEQEWQAQVLAMADSLIANKSIEPTRWSEAFGAGLAKAHAAGRQDDLDTYYAVALDTLEKLMMTQGALTRFEILKRCEAWKRAYLRTPHGQPVKL
jgi:hypothetical protein